MPDWCFQALPVHSPREIVLLPAAPPLPVPVPAAAPEVCSPALDPDPVAWAASRLNLTLDPYQNRILACTAHSVLLCCGRQTGKTTLAAIKALHSALHTSRAHVVIISRTLRQSAHVLRQVYEFASYLNCPLRSDRTAGLAFVFENGSRIVALPNNPAAVRGAAGVDLLIVDEAAFIQEETFSAVLPFLATKKQSALWLLSTPFGQSGFFYKARHQQKGEFAVFEVKSTECPRISPEFLARERLRLGDRFAQEYLCEFLSGDYQVLDRALLAGALDDSFPPLLIPGAAR